MTYRAKTILTIAVIFLIIGGIAQLIGGVQKQPFDAVYTQLMEPPRPAGETVGPLTLNKFVCPYIMPDMLHRALGWLYCASCMERGRAIAKHYTVTLVEGDCPGRVGRTNIMLFVRKP